MPILLFIPDPGGIKQYFYVLFFCIFAQKRIFQTKLTFMRIFKLLAIAATMLLACTSCMKEKEQNFSFVSVSSASNTISEEDLKAMADYVKTFEWFTKSHSYFGYYDDVVKLAADDFVNACKDIDKDVILSHLKVGEAFTIMLIAEKSGEILIYYNLTPENPEKE